MQEVLLPFPFLIPLLVGLSSVSGRMQVIGCRDMEKNSDRVSELSQDTSAPVAILDMP